MNAAHFHLLVNHLPILFPVAGLMSLGLGLVCRSEAAKRCGYLMFVVGAVGAGLAMWSGEGAEEVVERLSGVGDAEVHEELAERFAVVSYVLGGCSVLGFLATLRGGVVSMVLGCVNLVLGVGVVCLARGVGTSGGEIRHTEIRAAGGGVEGGRAVGGGEVDDD